MPQPGQHGVPVHHYYGYEGQDHHPQVDEIDAKHPRGVFSDPVDPIAQAGLAPQHDHRGHARLADEGQEGDGHAQEQGPEANESIRFEFGSRGIGGGNPHQRQDDELEGQDDQGRDDDDRVRAVPRYVQPDYVEQHDGKRPYVVPRTR